MRVFVYLPVEDERSLRKEGEDPAEWVRTLIRYALQKRREGNLGRVPTAGGDTRAK